MLTVTPPWTIRPARPDDGAVIADFNLRLAQESEGLALDPARVSAGVKAALADLAKARYFVACDTDGQIIGQIMHTWEWSDWRNGTLWWVQSVYVAPKWRGRGVFTSLLQTIRNLAAADPGVVGIRLYVEHNNERAQSAYKKSGLRPAGYEVYEELFS